MFTRSLTREACGNRWFGLLLMVSLLFAAQHLVMHDVDGAGGGPVGHQECQLNHLPYAQLPLALPGLPLLAPSVFLASPMRQYFHQILSHPWLARAPPPF